MLSGKLFIFFENDEELLLVNWKNNLGMLVRETRTRAEVANEYLCKSQLLI